MRMVSFAYIVLFRILCPMYFMRILSWICFLLFMILSTHSTPLPCLRPLSTHQLRHSGFSGYRSGMGSHVATLLFLRLVRDRLRATPVFLTMFYKTEIRYSCLSTKRLGLWKPPDVSHWGAIAGWMSFSRVSREHEEGLWRTVFDLFYCHRCAYVCIPMEETR